MTTVKWDLCISTNTQFPVRNHFCLLASKYPVCSCCYCVYIFKTMSAVCQTDSRKHADTFKSLEKNQVTIFSYFGPFHAGFSCPSVQDAWVNEQYGKQLFGILPTDHSAPNFCEDEPKWIWTFWKLKIYSPFQASPVLTNPWFGHLSRVFLYASGAFPRTPNVETSIWERCPARAVRDDGCVAAFCDMVLICSDAPSRLVHPRWPSHVMIGQKLFVHSANLGRVFFRSQDSTPIILIYPLVN